MLVLSRRKEQSIIIGDNVEVIVIDIANEQVKLGIIAPKAVSVHRKEVYEAIRAENIAAGRAKGPTDLNKLSELLRRPKDDEPPHN